MLWLLVTNDDLLNYHRSGPSDEQYELDLKVFRTTPYGQKAEYWPDYESKIRLLEDYKNMRSKIVECIISSIEMFYKGANVFDKK